MYKSGATEAKRGMVFVKPIYLMCLSSRGVLISGEISSAPPTDISFFFYATIDFFYPRRSMLLFRISPTYVCKVDRDKNKQPRPFQPPFHLGMLVNVSLNDHLNEGLHHLRLRVSNIESERLRNWRQNIRENGPRAPPRTQLLQVKLTDVTGQGGAQTFSSFHRSTAAVLNPVAGWYGIPICLPGQGAQQWAPLSEI